MQAAEFKPFITLQTASPNALIDIAEKVTALAAPTESANLKAQLTPYKNLPGTTPDGTIGLAIQTSSASPMGIDVLIVLPINNFAAFNIPNIEGWIDMLREGAQQEGSKYTFITPFGEIAAYQKTGYLVVATEGAAEFAATADPQTLFAGLDKFTLGIQVNIENLSQEDIEKILGHAAIIAALQGIEFDPEEFMEDMRECDGAAMWAQLADIASYTTGLTLDPKTLNVIGLTSIVPNKDSVLAEKFAKTKEALAKTKLGAFLPDTPQTVFSWHMIDYLTDRDIDQINKAWTVFDEGLMEGLLESIEDEDGEEEQAARLVEAVKLSLEYVRGVMDFFAQERLLDAAFWLDSEGTFISAMATGNAEKLAELDEILYGTLLNIFGGDAGKQFIEGKMKRDYETVAGYSISCVPNLLTDLPADTYLPEAVTGVVKDFPLSIFWAVKKGEALVYAAGLDFDKAEKTLKEVLGKTASPVPPKQTAAFALKPLGELLQKRVLPLLEKSGMAESDIAQGKAIFAKIAAADAGAKGVMTTEFTGDAFIQKMQWDGKLFSAFIDLFVQEGVMAARQAAKRMRCTDHIRQIVIAFHSYHDTHNAFPPLYIVDANGKPLHSWRVLILPYIEQTALYEAIRKDEPWDSEHNKQFHDKMPSCYQCPDNPGKGCCYAVIAGEAFVPAKAEENTGRSFAAIADGLSNTLAIVEVKQPFCWMDPAADVSLDELVKGINAKGRCGSFHPKGCNIGLFDASARFLPETVDKEVLRGLGDIDDGAIIAPW